MYTIYMHLLRTIQTSVDHHGNDSVYSNRTGTRSMQGYIDYDWYFRPGQLI